MALIFMLCLYERYEFQFSEMRSLAQTRKKHNRKFDFTEWQLLQIN